MHGCGRTRALSSRRKRLFRMPRLPSVPDELLVGPFRGSSARADGLVTKRQLQNPMWRQPLRDVYVHRDLADTPALRLAAVRLVVPDRLVVSGPAAAWLHGAAVGIDPLQLEVTGTYDERFASRRGVRRRHSQLDEGDVASLDDTLVTSPLRTAFDLSRFNDPLRGTAAVDAMLNRRLILPAEFAAYVDDHRGWTGVPRSRLVVRWMDAGAESLPETRLRLTIVWGGLPRPETQIEVRDQFGRVIARLDLGDRDKHVGAEYDGAQHEQSLVRDLARGNDLLEVGWRNFRFTARDLFQAPMVVVQRYGAAIGISPAPTRWFSLLRT